MSVLIRIKNIKTVINNSEKYVLTISTVNEEISFSSFILREEKEIGQFLIDKQIKKIQFTLRKGQKEGLHKYAYSQFCLYDLIDIPSKPVTIKKIGLKKYSQDMKDDHEAYEDGIFDQYLVISLEFKPKRRILKQIQKISEYSSITTESSRQPLVTNIESKQVKQPVYQQIDLLSQIQQKQVTNNHLSVYQNQQKEVEEIKQQAQSKIKYQEPIFFEEKRKENYVMISIPEVQNNALENISSILPKIEQKSNRNPKKASRQQQPKRPQIFEHLPQKDHIGINMNTNTFQVYHMCCGDQIDYSHQLQQSY